MSITNTPNLSLEKDSTDEFYNVARVNSNADKIDAEIGTIRAKLQSPVADLTALKAINTTLMVDKTMIFVESLGLYRYDAQSTATNDDAFIVQPTTGSGRWVKIADTAICYAANTSASDTYAVAIPGITGYYTGLEITFKATIANTTTCTLNVNALGAKTIVKNLSTAMETGDIVANQIVRVVYDGTNFQMVSNLSAQTTANGTQTMTNKTFTSPKIGTAILDTNGNEVIVVSPVASAVNEITVKNAIAGSAPSFNATGGDTDIDLNLAGKGNGVVRVNGLPAMFATAAAITYYVDSTKSNSNDGLTAGTAFQTIQYALDKLPKYLAHDVTINVVAGTYAEDVSVAGFVGSRNLYLRGASIATCFVRSMSFSNCTCYVYVDALTITSTTSTGINILRCTYANVISVSIIASAVSLVAIGVAHGSTAFIQNCVLSNHARGIDNSGSRVISITNTGTANIIGLLCSDAGTIGKNGSQPGGTTAESVSTGGVIR